MKVSVIIPIYNVEKYIEKCILSVLNQTYKNIELILIDDCGIDNSMKIVNSIIENYTSNYSIIVHRHTLNLGLSSARNSGIKISNGEYLFFLDSDDYISTNCIELLVESSFKHNSDLVVSNHMSFGKYNKNYNNTFNEDSLIGTQKIQNALFLNQWNNLAWNKLISKRVITENDLLFEENILHEDILWTFNLAKSINTLSFVNICTYFYLIRSNSITSEIKIQNIHDKVYIIGKLFSEHNQFKYNNHFFEFFEGHKLVLYKDLVRSKCTLIEKYQFYKEIKKYRYKSVTIYKLKQKMSLLRLLLYSHNDMPNFIGFGYINIFYRFIK